jgi:hypothetical protein
MRDQVVNIRASSAGNNLLCAFGRGASGVSVITFISLCCPYRLRHSPPQTPKLGAEFLQMKELNRRIFNPPCGASGVSAITLIVVLSALPLLLSPIPCFAGSLAECSKLVGAVYDLVSTLSLSATNP